MGYMKHHAIVITTFLDINKVYAKAIELFGDRCSDLMSSKMNGYTSFFIGPDGSKEGWDESKIGDEKRKILIDFIDN